MSGVQHFLVDSNSSYYQVVLYCEKPIIGIQRLNSPGEYWRVGGLEVLKLGPLTFFTMTLIVIVLVVIVVVN